MMNAWRLRTYILVSAAALCGAGVAAQSQPPQQAPKDKKEESLAELAKRAREQRGQKPVAQTVREFTNDTLAPGRAPGAQFAGGSGASGASETVIQGTSVRTAEDEGSRSAAEADLQKEREKLEGLKKQLELQEREAKLNKADYYGKPDYANDRTGAANITAADAAIAAKKSEMQESERKVAELEAKAKSINDRLGPRAEEPKTTEQLTASWAEKLRPLQEEVAKINEELAQIRRESAALGNSGSNPAGSFTGDRVAQLERRRAELQRQIDSFQDDARRAGTLPIRN